MENWTKVFRAYLKVHTVKLNTLSLSHVNKTLALNKEKTNNLNVNMRWRKLTNMILKAHY